MIRRVPDTSGRENFRMEPVPDLRLPDLPSGDHRTDHLPIMAVRRDPVEPVPVGSYVAAVFRVTGYDQDSDGSLMARLEAVDASGEITGWRERGIGLAGMWVLDSPGDLDPPAARR